MSFRKKILSRLRRELKFSVSNPESFNEVWSFNSTGIRVISLLVILFGLLCVMITFVLRTGFVSDYLNQDDISIEREKLEMQNEQILSLSEKIDAQDNYIANIKYILSGEVPVDFPIDSIQKMKDSISGLDFDSQMTDEEKKMAQKVKDDMSTFGNQDELTPIVFYGSPVIGEISQEFDAKNHPGIDVVTEKDRVVKACLSGTVVYSGYTHKDGYILIIEHDGGVISVYKHNKRVIKKTGSSVKLGDPIGIVGNTGENTDGPHLHFELWMDQTPVNPKDYIKFTR